MGLEVELNSLAPSATVLLMAVALDLTLGDPIYPLHPVRLIGRTLTWFERALWAMGMNAYGGGICLFLLLSASWVGCWSLLIAALDALAPPAGWAVHVFLVYSMIAMKDLLWHARRVAAAADAGDLPAARLAISHLVGRDTDRMDAAACRRAAIESISENLTDGFLSPIAWYAIAGVPGIVLFKVISTMDSMVGYKTPRYERFGWCGARADDLMNFIPARISWLLIAAVALFLPGCSASKAIRVAWEQHAIVPGPNSGWSEAAVAGAIQRRLIGPIWAEGSLVTDAWLGMPGDPEAGDAADLARASRLVLASGLLFASGVAVILSHCHFSFASF
jgi:adenosylcobinamide-phosphate synthase